MSVLTPLHIQPWILSTPLYTTHVAVCTRGLPPLIAPYLQSQISLLCRPQSLHLPTEARLFYRKSAKLADDGSRLRAHVIAKHAAKQVQGQTPASQHHVMRDDLTYRRLVSARTQTGSFPTSGWRSTLLNLGDVPWRHVNAGNVSSMITQRWW